MLAASCVAGPVVAADDDLILARVKGDVGYALGAPAGAPHPVFGRIALPPDAYARTAFRAAARVTLPDSSLIDIGDRTTVQLGRFARDGNVNGTTIALDRGAVRFDIRRPAGKRSSYRFVTATTQIAVRGTVAYLVSGPRGDQLYCIDCAPGDVTVTTNSPLGTFAVESGQTLNVRRTGERALDASLVANATINNPAIDQFLGGFSPFGQPAAGGTDSTGSESGN